MKYFLIFSLLTSPAFAQVTSYNQNGVTTPVKKDTSTPANSRGLPVQSLNTSGVQIDPATEGTLQQVKTDTAIITGPVNNAGAVALPPSVQVSGIVSGAGVTSPISVDVNGRIITSEAANTTGAYAEITNLTTVAQTFTAPANAVGFLIETLSSNTVNVRYKVGATATTTSGVRLEPGRSEYLPLAADISVIAESGTNQVVTVQWVVK